MSNYTKSTNFTSKDSLPSGDALKIVKGAEFDTEFNAIATAVSTKADLASPALTGTPTAPTASVGTDTTQIATAALVTAAMQALYPVGSVYTNASVATNPGTLLGFGTWSAFAAGRVLVGFNASNTLFDTAEETGGSADAIVVSHTHTATVTDPGHLHTHGVGGSGSGFNNGILWNQATVSPFDTGSSTTGVTVANSTTGSSGTNANYQPYITVYMWKRTA